MSTAWTRTRFATLRSGGRSLVATRRRHKAQERLLVVDESLSTKLAGRLRERGREAKSAAELGYGGLLDPLLLRTLFRDYPEAVLVTADDNMPLNHPLIIEEVGATIATIEPWERRERAPLVVPEGSSEDECWKREVLARWAHVMAAQERGSKRRYAKERHAEWRPRIRTHQRRLFS